MIWLEQYNVEDIGNKLSIKTVPIIGRTTLSEGVEIARQGYDSQLCKVAPEGLVCDL